MDRRQYYSDLYRQLTRFGYQPLKYGEEIYFQKKQEDRILLLRLVQEPLPGQNPADPETEHLALKQLADKIMIVNSTPVETLLVLLRTEKPDNWLISRIQDYEDVWILNRRSGRLTIYEKQKGEFYGLERWIEDFTIQWNEMERKVERKRITSTFTPVNTAIVLTNILVFLVLSLLGNTEDPSFMAGHGGLVYHYVVEEGRYYLLFTSMFIHFGIQHLGQNMLILILMGGTVERYLGKVSYAILYLLSGLISSYASLQLTLAPEPNTVSGGASGAIFGVMGGLLFIILENVVVKRRKSVEGMTLRGMIFIILVSAGYGFAVSDVDNAAHLGGLAAGFVLTLILVGIKGLISLSRKKYGKI